MDLTQVESPAFVVDLEQLRRNAELLAEVQRTSGAKILLALKAYGAWSTFDLLSQHLTGTTASGAHEARLGRECFGGECHVFSPAYSEPELRECLQLCDHLVFNSLAQWRRYRALCLETGRKISCGLRINPEHSEVKTPLYDPCRPGSRLGIPLAEFPPQELKDELEGIQGLHFHTLCELGADALKRTVEAVEAKWAQLLPQLQWVNFGGGHHITRPGYDIELLSSLVRAFSQRWGVQVYLEPGEAVALNAGVLVATVLDVIHNDGAIAILDVSPTAHMPDVLEMPYRPQIRGAGSPGEFPYEVELGGVSCLAGDVIGRYSFPKPLQVGQRLVFEDMAIYSMVKTTFFNGVRHPCIAVAEAGREPRVVRRFGYEDYRDRLS